MMEYFTMLPITLEHVLLQIGVVEKQDVIVVDNNKEQRQSILPL